MASWSRSKRRYLGTRHLCPIGFIVSSLRFPLPLACNPGQFFSLTARVTSSFQSALLTLQSAPFMTAVVSIDSRMAVHSVQQWKEIRLSAQFVPMVRYSICHARNARRSGAKGSRRRLQGPWPRRSVQDPGPK